jgi:hypothetical protein
MFEDARKRGERNRTELESRPMSDLAQEWFQEAQNTRHSSTKHHNPSSVRPENPSKTAPRGYSTVEYVHKYPAEQNYGGRYEAQGREQVPREDYEHSRRSSHPKRQPSVDRGRRSQRQL